MAKGPHTIAKEAFALRLRELRHAAGLSMSACARGAGIDPGQWQRYEVARNRPGIDKAPRIAAGLGIPIAALFPTTDGSTVVAEVRASQETLANIRANGRSACHDTAQRIAAGLEPLLWQAANPAPPKPYEPRKRGPRNPRALTRYRRSAIASSEE